MEFLSAPKLWNASYTPQSRFSVEDVEDFVEYARQRGVRVIAEIDLPGHASAFCKGYPEVCPSATCLDPLDPSTNATFDLIGNILGEIAGGRAGAGRFPDNLIHLGGDEVSYNCEEAWGWRPAIHVCF